MLLYRGEQILKSQFEPTKVYPKQKLLISNQVGRDINKAVWATSELSYASVFGISNDRSEFWTEEPNRIHILSEVLANSLPSILERNIYVYVVDGESFTRQENTHDYFSETIVIPMRHIITSIGDVLDMAEIVIDCPITSEAEAEYTRLFDLVV